MSNHKQWCDHVSRLCCPLCHQSYLDWAKTYIWTYLMASSVTMAAALLCSQQQFIFTTNYTWKCNYCKFGLTLWDSVVTLTFTPLNQGLYLNFCTSSSLVLPKICYWLTKPMIYIVVVEAIIHGQFSYTSMCAYGIPWWQILLFGWQRRYRLLFFSSLQEQ